MRDPRDLLQEAEVFVMASHSEGTSMSLLEAMACGCCPVVTAVGGNPSVLGAQLAHRLVSPGDPIALATALHGAVCDRARLLRDRELARLRVATEFSLERMGGRYVDIYDRIRR
jgi:glycosyltransferase involved in cell wall biosynthesis